MLQLPELHLFYWLGYNSNLPCWWNSMWNTYYRSSVDICWGPIFFHMDSSAADKTNHLWVHNLRRIISYPYRHTKGFYSLVIKRIKSSLILVDNVKVSAMFLHRKVWISDIQSWKYRQCRDHINHSKHIE